MTPFLGEIRKSVIHELILIISLWYMLWYILHISGKNCCKGQALWVPRVPAGMATMIQGLPHRRV